MNVPAFRKILLLLALTGISYIAFGQKYNFQTFDTDAGLPQNFIYHISQDRYGRLLLSTGEGFALYDGHQFKIYGKKDSLAENFINTHYEDSRGWYWLGHYQEGISIIKKDSVVKLSDPRLKGARVTAIAEDDQKNILAAAFGKGLFKISPAGEIAAIPTNNVTINDIFFHEGKLIVASTEGLHVYAWENGSMQLQKSAELLEYMQVNAVMADNNGYLAATNEAVYYLNERLQIRRKYDQVKKAESIAKDGKGNIWAGTFGSGVYKIHAGEEKISRYTAKSGLVNNFVKDVYVDRENNAWIGTYGNGLVQVNEKFIFYDEFDSGEKRNILSIAPSSAEKLWLGTESGLISFSPDSSFAHQQISGVKVTALYNDGSSLWIGTERGGLYRKDLQSNEIQILNSKHDFSAVNINHITGKGSRIYIATTQGLYFYNKISGNFTRFTTRNGLLHNNIYHLLIDSQDRLWIASHGSRLYYFQAGNFYDFKKIRDIELFDINSLAQDSAGNIWIATEGEGVVVFNEKEFKQYTVNEGLASNYCYALLAQNNEIWVGHKNGVSYKSPQQQQFITYTKDEGFLSPHINQNAIFSDKQGNIYFGTLEGLMKYNRSYDNTAANPPHTFITGISINNEPVKLKNDLELKYGKYSITFDFTGVTLTHPSKTQYKYKLEGLEEDWNITGSNHSFAHYRNLRDGDYIFKVFTMNEEGIWSESPAAFSFSIRTPIWKKAWFYFAIAVFLLLVFLFIIRWRTKAILEANKELEERVNEKTQLLQAEKDNVEKVKAILEEKNKDITDSINYARRIQMASLPQADKIQEKLECFIFYRPRDIVSGDFYWFTEKRGKLIIAAVDCTGHGVPGAFMSLVGATLLDKIVNDHSITSPGEILTQMNNNVVELMHQKSQGNTTKDGMDMALCSIDRAKKELVFAGAVRPLYNVNGNGLQEVKGSIYPIGGYLEGVSKSYEEHIFKIKEEDTFYICSDGYADQFGGPKGKKFMKKKLKKLLTEIADKSVAEQKITLSSVFDEWKGKLPQVDDVLIIGFKA